MGYRKCIDKMRILITGGHGYIGGRLTQYFCKNKSYNVVVGTRKKTFSKIADLDYNVLQLNWNSNRHLNDVCRGTNVILHLAGMNLKESNLDPISAIKFNTLTTAKFIAAAINQGVEKFIYFSTAHVYRNPLKGVITENSLTHSLDSYAISNRAAEDIVRSAVHNGKIDGCVIRLSNSFGAPINKEVNCWSLVINDLCRQAIINKKMELKSTGLQRRDFITIEDVCLATDHLISSKNLKTNLFNLGGDWSPSILDVANLIQERTFILFGYKPEIYVNKYSNEKSYKLTYKSELIKKNGFKLSSNRIEEIDNLLFFCTRNFKLY